MDMDSLRLHTINWNLTISAASSPQCHIYFASAKATAQLDTYSRLQPPCLLSKCKLIGNLAPCSIHHQSIGSPHAAPYMSISTNSGVPLLHMLPLPLLLENQFSPRNYILHKSWSGISLLLQRITYVIIHFFNLILQLLLTVLT